MPLQLDFAATTHRGTVRQVNEDAVIATPPVFVVADGIGGAGVGDRAAQIVVGEFMALASDAKQANTPSRALTDGQPDGAALNPDFASDLTADDVSDALMRAHRQIYALSQRLPKPAASTASGCIAHDVDGRGYWLAFNIGDSRIYRCSGGPGRRRIKQVSVDHSYVQELVDSGQLHKRDSFTHPNRNVVTRAIGALPDTCQADFWMLPMVAGERILICSDGLLADSPADDVRAIVKSGSPSRQVVADLLEVALGNGARDNVSVIVIDVEPGFEPATDEVSADSGRVGRTAGRIDAPVPRRAAPERVEVGTPWR